MERVVKSGGLSPAVTPDLLMREVEVIFLERLGRDPTASAWLSVQCREIDVLTALRRRLPKAALTVDDVLGAAEASPALNVRAAPPQVVDGQLSRQVLLCHPRKLPGVTSAAGQADFARLAKAFNAAGHRPAPLLSVSELVLKAVEGGRKSTKAAGFEGSLTVRNAGYGSDDAIEVQRVICPAWLTASVDGRRVTLQTRPAFNGCYRGVVTVETDAGPATLTVISRHWRCPELTQNPVSWRDLATPHADLEQESVAHLVEAHLTAAGYRSLAGGFFAKGDEVEAPRVGAQEETVTCTWTITARHLKEGRLPARGHAALVRLYAPDGTDRFDVPFDGEALHGEALSDLFLMWDVKAGRELHLTPYRGHYQFDVRRPGTWLHAPASEYRVVTTLQALNRTPLFWDQVEDWLTGGSSIKFLLHGSEIDVLQELRRRFRARLDVRTTTQPIGEDRLLFLSDDGSVKVRRLPDGQSLRGGAWPEDLWAQSAPTKRPRGAAAVTPTPVKATPEPAKKAAKEAAPPSVLPRYTPWSGPVAHPQLMGTDKVLRSVKAILEAEGPMVGHHLYARYGEAVRTGAPGAALSPMQLKKALNPLLYRAVQSGQLAADDEFGLGGQVSLVYRLPGQAPRPRQKGDRTLERIPVSEVRAVVDLLPAGQPSDELEQVAWVLEQFGFGRFIEGGVGRVRPLLRERDALSRPTEQSRRSRVR